MKRSEVNAALQQAVECFTKNGWALPPQPRWDLTDFGLGDFERCGLILVNLCEEDEYCEKLMYARRGMMTPMHHHGQKKEDIICRWGRLKITVEPSDKQWVLKRNGESIVVSKPTELVLDPGERVTLWPGMWHEFEPVSEECIIGEVSTYNDDEYDNHFRDPNVGRFPVIEEDEPAKFRLIGDPK